MIEHSRTGVNRGRYEYGSIGEEPRRRGRRPRGILGLLSALGPILYFPMMLFYLEMAFHIYTVSYTHLDVYKRQGQSYIICCCRLTIEHKQ